MRRILVIFFLDAVRYDDLKPVDTPFLCEMAKKGIFGPLQTILGFDGIAPTIFTGTYPDVHGVWTQHLSADGDGVYNWINPIAPVLGKIDECIDGSALWKAFRFATLKSSLFINKRTQYPGINKVPFSLLPKFDFSMRHNLYEKNAFGSVPSLFDLLGEKHVSYAIADHSAFENDQKVVQKVLHLKEPPGVVYVRLMDLDNISHAGGVFSPQRRHGLRMLDWSIFTVYNHFKHLGMDPTFVLFADHGFMDVVSYLDVMRCIISRGVPQEDFTVFLDSTLARFWGDDQTIRRISRALLDLKTGRVLTDTDLRHYHVPKSSRYGNLIYLADPGVVILPNYYDGSNRVKGMHGYKPETPEMHTLLLVYHDKITARKIDATMIDVLPTMLELVGISKPEYCTGMSKLSD